MSQGTAPSLPLPQWDQVQAATREVLAVLAGASPRQARFAVPAPQDLIVVEHLMEHVLTRHDGWTSVCRHVRGGAFDRAPRPLVLDTVRGILACRKDCYPVRARIVDVVGGVSSSACISCGGDVGQPVGHDLLIGYGPILVLAALCPECLAGVAAD